MKNFMKKKISRAIESCPSRNPCVNESLCVLVGFVMAVWGSYTKMRCLALWAKVTALRLGSPYLWYMQVLSVHYMSVVVESLARNGSAWERSRCKPRT
jgi:hypothetical protein